MASLGSIWQKLAGKTPVLPSIALGFSASQSERSMVSVSQMATARLAVVPKDPISDQYQPLWELLNQRQLIEVKVEGSSLAYQTLILAIDIQRGLLWLDDLFPSQHMLEVGDRISLRHHRNGEQLCFSSPILAWGSNYGASGLAVMLPEQLSYAPRRQFNRAQMNNDLAVKIRPLGQDISYGRVLDVSGGGLGVSIPGNILGQLRHGALMPLCELSLSDELSIRCSARVRGFRLVRSPHRQTHISLEFVGLPQERQDQLQQFINNLVYLQNNTEERRSA